MVLINSSHQIRLVALSVNWRLKRLEEPAEIHKATLALRKFILLSPQTVRSRDDLLAARTADKLLTLHRASGL